MEHWEGQEDWEDRKALPNRSKSDRQTRCSQCLRREESGKGGNLRTAQSVEEEQPQHWGYDRRERADIGNAQEKFPTNLFYQPHGSR